MYHRLPRPPPPPSRSQLPRLLIYTPHDRRNKQFLFHVTITISNEGFEHEDQSCINTKPPPELAHRDSRAAKVGKRHTRGTERAEKGQEYERKQEKKNIKKGKNGNGNGIGIHDPHSSARDAVAMHGRFLARSGSYFPSIVCLKMDIQED